MRLPFVQVADKYIEAQSKVVAKKLEINRRAAIGLGVQLFAFAVQVTSTEDTPPTGVFEGEDALDVVEAGIDWDGEPGKAVGAFVRADVIERLENGYRVRGMDRYREAWEKQHRGKVWNTDPALSEARSEAGRKGAEARESNRKQNEANGKQNGKQTEANAKQTGSKPQANVKQNQALDGDGDGDGDGKEELQQQAVVVEKLAGVPEPEEFEPDSTGEFKPTAWGFWGYHNQLRQEHELFDEPTPPQGLKAWHDAAQAKVGIPGLVRSYTRYLADRAFANTGWPFSIFMSPNVWLPRANDAPAPRRFL